MIGAWPTTGLADRRASRPSSALAPHERLSQGRVAAFPHQHWGATETCQTRLCVATDYRSSLKPASTAGRVGAFATYHPVRNIHRAIRVSLA